jgi:hypothetical protein
MLNRTPPLFQYADAEKAGLPYMQEMPVSNFLSGTEYPD